MYLQNEKVSPLFMFDKMWYKIFVLLKKVGKIINLINQI